MCLEVHPELLRDAEVGRRRTRMRTFKGPMRIKIRGKLARSYYARCYDTTTQRGTWLSTGRTSLEAARLQLRQWEKEDASGRRETENPPLTEALKARLETKGPKMTPRGYEAYAHHAGTWGEFFGRTTRVGQFTIDRVEAFFRHRAPQVSPATANKVRKQMRQFCRWCRDRGWLAEDPTRTIEKYTEQRPQIRALDLEEQQALLRSCLDPYSVKASGIRNLGGSRGGKRTPVAKTWIQNKTPPWWLYPFAFLGLRTGLRYANIEGLRWDQIDLRKKLIRIDPGEMKAREGLVIPITEEVAGFLRALKKNTEGLTVLRLPSYSDVRRALRLAAKRAGIAPLRPHDLRATFITTCRKAGADIEAVAGLVGHRDIQTTLRYYRKISQEDLRKAVEKLSDGNPGAGPPAAEAPGA
jgi:integrase